MPSLPPLSHSILGVEPLDEFILEIANFVHHMISMRPDVAGNVEVEAKIGLLRDTVSGERLLLPVLVETSTKAYYLLKQPYETHLLQFLPRTVLICDSNPTCQR